MTLIRFAYNLLFPLVLVVLLPGFLHRMLRRGKYRHKFWQRFGIYSARVRERMGTGRTWVHAVSVGEVMIALKLIRALREQDSAAAFVLSTTTSTGFRIAARAKAPWLEPIYNPIDFFPTARRAVRTIRPSRLVLVEAEAWPNILAETRRLGAGIAMVNTRLSPRSERRYRAVRPLVAPVFNQIDRFCLQDAADVARWTGLGVDPSKLVVTGSIKFDDEAAQARESRDFRPVLRSLGVEKDAPVLLGGSTFPGEEGVLANALLELRKSIPNLFLILVPRHVERSPEILRELTDSGLSVACRRGPLPSNKPDLLLVDTTGELRDWYTLATIVFVGKSLCARGGQNPAEAITAGAPVLFGPHMQNFATLARQFLTANAAVEISDTSSLVQAAASLIRDPQQRARMVRSARACLQVHAGATSRTCAELAMLRSAARE